jgi:RNA polymerase ECF-type sigma factor
VDENAERISLELIAGDEQAFDTVYKQYYRGLCAFASQYVTVPESEEIVQDVMMWLWENRKSLVADMSLKSLLFTIVRNKCLNTISHIQVKQQVHERLYAKFQEQFENPDFYIGELMALASKALPGAPG